VAAVAELGSFGGFDTAQLGWRYIMLTLFTRRPIVAGGLLIAITLATVSLGVAGWARWRESQARSQVQD